MANFNRFVSLFFLLLANPIQANESVVCTVLEKGTGRLLSRVEVRVEKEILYTNPQGQVTVSGELTTKVLFTKSGFEKKILSLEELQKNRQVFLFPGAPDDNEVIIKGSRRQEISRKSISVEETTRIAPGGDPVQITKILPGVQTQSFNQRLIIRGSGPNDSRYYVDDLRVLNIFHNIGNVSIIPDQIIDQVDFSSGGFGAQYGNATGGIVVLKTTTAIPDSPYSEVKLNVPFLTTFFHERPLSEDSALVLSLRHSLTEFIVPSLVKKFADGNDDVFAVPTFSDAHIRYLKKEESGFYKVSLITSHDGIEAAFPIDDFADESGTVGIEFDSYFGVVGIEKSRRLGNGQKMRSTPQIYFTQQDANFSDFKVDINFYELSAPTEWQKRLGKGRYLYVGINPTLSKVELDIEAPQPNEEDPFFDAEEAETITVDENITSKALSAWVSLDYKWEKLSITPGLHSYHSEYLKDSFLDPRLSLFYRIQSSLGIKGSIGQYSMEPEPREAAEEVGNPELGFETANHFILGVEGKIGDRWEYDFQVFRKRIYHLVRTHPTKKFEDEGTLLVDGFEFFLRRNMTEKAFGWIAYTYSQAKEKRNDQVAFHRSQYDQTHNLNLALAYKLTAKWEVGTRIKFASGAPYTPATGGKYNANLDKFSPTFDAENPNSKKFTDYDQSDIFATYESFFNTWKLQQRFGLQLISIKKPVSSVEYSYDYRQSRMVSNSLPPIPFYEIKARF